jgi:acyl-CoA reductase-like NAD-dependent aldehyde dehydrogenase
MMVDGMARLRSVNPATEEELASFPQHTAEDLDRALAEADAAQRDWERTPLEERAQVLVEIARLLRQRRPEYARLATMEMGKPIAEAEAEVDKCAWNCEFYAEQAAQFLADEPVRTRPRPATWPTSRWVWCWPSCPGTSRSGRSCGSPLRR